jgi:hypothetical protein
MKDIRYYLSLPWTIERSEHHDDGDYVALRVKELPGFLIASADEGELNAIFWVELEAFLRTYMDDGEEPPVPAGVGLKERLQVTPRVYASPSAEAPGWDSQSVEFGETAHIAPGQLQSA